MATKVITRACIAVFVGGLGGLIIASIAGNNNGVVLSIGAAIVLAAIVLMAVNTVTVTDRIDALVEASNEAADEAAAAQLEVHITRLVEQGANENDVRSLVREARLVRGKRR